MSDDKTEVKNVIMNLEAEKSLDVINLNGTSVSDSDIATIANLLQDDNKLVSMDVSRTDISHKGLCLLFQGLSNISTLQSLSLQDLLINDDTFQQFATYLETQHSLVNLNLASTRISASNVDSLFSILSKNCSKTLKTLNLNYIDLSDMNIEIFFVFLKEMSELTELHLQNCKLTNDILLSFIEFMKDAERTNALTIYMLNNNFDEITCALIKEEAQSYSGKFLFFLSSLSKEQEMDTLDDELHNESSSIEEPSFSLESNIRCRRSSCDSTFNDLNENYKIAAQKIIYILYQTQFTEEEKKQEEYQLVHIPEHIIDTNTQIKTPEDPQDELVQLRAQLYFHDDPYKMDDSTPDLDDINSLNVNMNPHQLATCLCMCTDYIDLNLNNEDPEALKAILQVYVDHLHLLLAILKKEQSLKDTEHSFALGPQLTNSAHSLTRVGIIRASIVDLVNYMLKYNKNNDIQIEKLLLEEGYHDILFNLFFTYKWNNALHLCTQKYFDSLIEFNYQQLLTDLFTRYHLLQKMKTELIFIANNKKNNIPCSGQFGFLYEMIMTVQQKVLNNDPFFTPFVQEIEDWDSFYNHYMTPYRDLLDLQIGGPLPQKIEDPYSFSFMMEQYSDSSY